MMPGLYEDIVNLVKSYMDEPCQDFDIVYADFKGELKKLLKDFRGGVLAYLEDMMK